MEEVGLEFPEREYKMRSLKCENPDQTSVKIEQILQTNSVENLRQVTKSSRDTDPVNLAALFKHGTIEFRAHSGTVDAQDILSWIKCLNSLVKLSQEMTQNQKAHLPQEMKEFLGNKNTETKNGSELDQIQKIFAELRLHNRCILNALPSQSPEPNSCTSPAPTIAKTH